MKTPSQIIKEHSPRPTSVYDNSWVIEAMKTHSKQWIDEAAEVAMLQAEKGLPVGDAIYELKNIIDKQ